MSIRKCSLELPLCASTLLPHGRSGYESLVFTSLYIDVGGGQQ